MLECSFSFLAARLLVKTRSALQKSECCSAVSAAQLSENRNATSLFRLWHAAGVGFRGVGFRTCWSIFLHLQVSGSANGRCLEGVLSQYRATGNFYITITQKLQNLFPLTAFKITPNPKFVQNFVPAIVLGGSSQGSIFVWKWRFFKFWQFFSNFWPPDWNPQKQSLGQILDKLGVRGVFECCKGKKVSQPKKITVPNFHNFPIILVSPALWLPNRIVFGIAWSR